MAKHKIVINSDELDLIFTTMGCEKAGLDRESDRRSKLMESLVYQCKK
tara:strand:+ start:396 stop:539 length:144 start_codon:yes stop_codon:yes gene_type:complete